MSDIVLLVGLQASGKSQLAEKYKKQGYKVLSRDIQGGKVADLLPIFEYELKMGENIVIDNTHSTVEMRQPFVQATQKAGESLRCEWMTTSKEDCQINALHRMWDRYGRLFLGPDDFEEEDFKKDPNMFPPAALWAIAKKFEEHTAAEGFSKVEKVKFVRKPFQGKHSALILDYDQNLRDVPDGVELGYPVKTEEVILLPRRKEVLDDYIAKHKPDFLLGASNQSGVHKGTLTYDRAVECFVETNKQLDMDIQFHFCPHRSSPPGCYCRKPQSGMGVYMMRKFDLNPKKVLFVGDQTSDKTWAKRLGFEFQHTHNFFGPDYAD